jgi:hypothetical protein
VREENGDAALAQVLTTQQYQPMADEPENLTLVLLREIRAEQERLAIMLGKVTDAVTEVAATQNHQSAVLARHSEILTHHSGLLEKINETQQNYGARLNAIDGRLAIIERHTGLVKA